MYQNDSFFTLSQSGQFGLALLSLTLAVICLLLVVLLRRKPRWQSVIAALAIFFVFVWASPQVYYQYYRLIIDGLPAQWVINSPPSLGHLARLVTFQAEANLSAQSRGVLFWLLMLAAIVRWRSATRSRNQEE